MDDYFVTPRRLNSWLPRKPMREWPTELLIDMFYEMIDGWYLEVAHRCIDGWKNEHGEQCINATLFDGRPAFQIPDSGWAVLQIVLSYFETFARIRFNKPDAKESFELFCAGVVDVFPDHAPKENQFNIPRFLYSELRDNLYHGRVRGGSTFLIHEDNVPAIRYDADTGRVKIDPHHFVAELRMHLARYCSTLKDESNLDLREKFRRAFLKKYGESTDSN